MANVFVRILVFFLLLDVFMVRHSEASVVAKAAKRVYGSVFGFILSANEALKDYFASEADGTNIDSEEESDRKVEAMEMLYQGDIVLDPQTYRLIKGPKDSRTKRNAHRSRSYLWTSRIIPYFIPSKMEKIRKNLKTALEELHSKTCLRFVPYSGQRNFLYFDDNRGCSSMIGKLYYEAGKQTVSIADGCNSHGTIIHELLHAVGFWHEQSRPDRDKFVKINYENINPKMRDQFDKYDFRTIDDLGKDYDFESVMHYGRTTYTVNGNPTIEAIHDSTLDFGNDHLSEKDVIEINALYDCDTNFHGWTAWSHFTPCDGQCMRTRQRYCYHPKNDFSQCAGANSYGIQKEQKACTPCPEPIDGHWGNWGYWEPCTASCDDGMKKRTRQCNNPAPAHGGKHCPGNAEEEALCMIKRCLLNDDDTDFEDNRMGFWKNSRQDDFDWQLLKGPTQTRDTGPMFDHTSGKGYYLYTESSAPRVKGDVARLITPWRPYVPGGQCIKFSYHMYGINTGSLGLWMELNDGKTRYYLFHSEGNLGNAWRTTAKDIDPPKSVGYRLIFEATLKQGGYSDIAIDDVYIDPGLCDCQDVYVSCKKWAASGECTKNDVWMAKHCKRSCRICKAVIPTSLTTEMITEQPMAICIDNNPIQCPLWAERGECTINPAYMNENCAKSCGICGCKDSDPVQCPLWAAKDICKTNPQFMLVKCVKSCNVCHCHDNDVSCTQWALQGECTKNPTHMMKNCKRSCKVCK